MQAVDEERGRVKASVWIFGGSTPVELAYNGVEKV
jgi:transcription antitermination factor NusG